MKKKTLLLVVLSCVLCSCTNTNKPTSITSSANVDSSIVTSSSDTSSTVSSSSSSEEIKYVDITVVGGNVSQSHVVKGTEVQLQADEPEEHYVFFGWNDEKGTTISLDPEYSFLAEENVTLTAVFQVKKYGVTVLNGKGTGSYDYGKTVSVTANGKEGYTFIGWVNDKDETVSTDSTYQFVVNGDITLTAKYKENFKLPTSIDDIRNSISSFAQMANKTASVSYVQTDYHYSSSISDYTYNEKMNFYNNGFYSTGNYSNSETTTSYVREGHLENGRLQKIELFPNTYRGSAAISEKVGENGLTNSIANGYINNFGLVEVLKENVNADVMKFVDTFEAVEKNDKCELTIVGHYTDSTMYYRTIVKLIYDRDFFVYSLETKNEEFVIATQCVDGKLVENPVARYNGYNLTSYQCNILETDKPNYPADKDQRNQYFISDFKITGRYYEGSVQRYFTSDNPYIWKGAEIQSNYVEMIKDTIAPATYLETETLTIISSSNEDILKLVKNSAGKVSTLKAVGVGKVILAVETSNGIQKNVELEVKEYLPPKSFDIDCADEVKIDEEILLDIKDLTPSTSLPTFNWLVDDETKAEIVIKDGKTYLKGKAAGDVVLCAVSTGDSSKKIEKTVHVVKGELSTDELRQALVGTWVNRTKESGFTFIFNEDGTFQCIDTYRLGSKINCTGKFTVTTKKESDMTHNFKYDTDIKATYIAIEISDIVIGTDDPKNADKIVMHFGISPTGTDLVCHVNVNDGNSMAFETKKM